jgi:hypothetical protein
MTGMLKFWNSKEMSAGICFELSRTRKQYSMNLHLSLQLNTLEYICDCVINQISGCWQDYFCDWGVVLKFPILEK